MHKTLWIVTLAATVIGLALGNVRAGKAVSDSLRLTQQCLVPVFETEPAGTLSLSVTRQGQADNQQFRLVLKNLNSAEPYFLSVTHRGDTNFVDVSAFTSTTKGKATVQFSHIVSTKGQITKDTLPPSLNPLSDVTGIAVVDLLTQVVFQADCLNPDKFSYQVQRALCSNPGVEPLATGALSIKATQTRPQFSLKAALLAPNATYFLALNDAIITSFTSDPQGNLSILTLPEGATNLLAITSLSLLNSSTGTVLRTTLLPAFSCP